MNLLQLCGHQGPPPPPTGGGIWLARASCPVLSGQKLNERAVEIKDRDLAPAGRVQIGGVKTGALGRLDPLEGWRGLGGCTTRVLAGFREERMVWTALVSFGLKGTGLALRFGIFFDGSCRLSTAIRFLDEDATSQSDRRVSTVRVERLARILVPWLTLSTNSGYLYKVRK